MKKIDSAPYKVDKGILLTRKRLDAQRFPFQDMEIGDSFLIPKIHQSVDSSRLSVYTAVKSFNAHNGKTYKISTRELPEGLRVWRIL